MAHLGFNCPKLLHLKLCPSTNNNFCKLSFFDCGFLFETDLPVSCCIECWDWILFKLEEQWYLPRDTYNISHVKCRLPIQQFYWSNCTRIKKILFLFVNPVKNPISQYRQHLSEMNSPWTGLTYCTICNPEIKTFIESYFPKKE